MEQKKLLLIAISVGVFFVIVIGTALVFLKPAADMVSTGSPHVYGTSYIGAGNYTGGELRPLAVAGGEPPVPDQFPPANSAGNFAENGLNLESSAGAYLEADNVYEDTPSSAGYYEENSPRTLITVEQPKSAAGVPSAPVPQRTASPAPSRPAETRPAAASSTASSSSTNAAPRSGTPAPSRTRDDYWVQTGAFTVLSRAENVKQTLADKGITSIIENRSVGETLYFRVRIGPYTSQNEADYWLNLIKSINGFEDSQIRKTQTVL